MLMNFTSDVFFHKFTILEQHFSVPFACFRSRCERCSHMLQCAITSCRWRYWEEVAAPASLSAAGLLFLSAQRFWEWTPIFFFFFFLSGGCEISDISAEQLPACLQWPPSTSLAPVGAAVGGAWGLSSGSSTAQGLGYSVISLLGHIWEWYF